MPIAEINFRDPAAVEQFIRASFCQNRRRLQHIEVIAAQVRRCAEQLRSNLPGCSIDPDMAYCAALLHDVGYVPDLRVSGFHPKDGADFLRSRGFGDLAELIEGHGCSPEEAALLGHPAVTPAPHLIAKLITYWDMRVKQGGAIVTYSERLQDILFRYGESSVVGRANLAAQSRLEAIAREVEGLLQPIK